MTISNQNPVADYLLEHGDSFSFDLDTGGAALTNVVITIFGDATEVAYTGGVAQSGYSVTVTVAGDVYTYTVSRSAGWNASPFDVQVDYDLAAVGQSASWSYELRSERTYPSLMQPRNPVSQGTLIITDNGVAVRTDVGWIDLVGFTVVDQGSGKVKLTSGGSGGGGGGGAFGTWNLNSTSSTNPSTGEFSVNSSTPGSVSVIEVHDTDNSAREHTGVMAAVPKGSVIALIDGTEYFLYQVVSQSPSASYTSFTVGFLAATSGSTFGVASDYTVSFSFNTNDHGTLTGLADDDHTQYHTDARGDARYYTQAQLDVSLGLKADAATAIETDVAGEIAGLAEKTTPVDADVVLIEDSADSNNKKKVTFANLPGGSALAQSSGTYKVVGFQFESVLDTNALTTGDGEFFVDSTTVASVTNVRFYNDQKSEGSTGEVTLDPLFTDVQAGDQILMHKVSIAGDEWVLWDIDTAAGKTGNVWRFDVTLNTQLGTTLNNGSSYYFYILRVITDNFGATVKNSIEVDADDLQLVNDEASPGNNKVYGTDGAGTKGWKDDPAGGGSGGQQVTLASNETVAVDTTEVVIGGGYFDGSTGGTYSFRATFIYNDGGGGGTQDASINIYNDAGTLISTLYLDSSVDGLDTLVTKTQALTTGTPTFGGSIINAAGDIYEARAYVTATGGLDSVTVYNVEMVES